MVWRDFRSIGSDERYLGVNQKEVEYPPYYCLTIPERVSFRFFIPSSLARRFSFFIVDVKLQFSSGRESRWAGERENEEFWRDYNKGAKTKEWSGADISATSCASRVFDCKAERSTC